MKIGILEDNPGMCRMLQLYLENEGYACNVFQTVRDFLAFIADHRTDLIIVDFRLMSERERSRITGAEVIRLVREDHPELPAILISAAPMFMLWEAAKDIADVHIMQKPFKMSFLVETIEALSK